jgi:hypothetical protein
LWLDVLFGLFHLDALSIGNDVGDYWAVDVDRLVEAVPEDLPALGLDD